VSVAPRYPLWVCLEYIHNDLDYAWGSTRGIMSPGGPKVALCALAAQPSSTPPPEPLEAVMACRLILHPALSCGSLHKQSQAASTTQHMLTFTWLLLCDSSTVGFLA
jgi:hypothetical protein